MIPKKQLSSYVRIQEKPDGNEQRILDLSKKQLRKINQLDLGILLVSKIDLSYNFLKNLALINIIKNQNPPQQFSKQPNQKSTIKIPSLTWLDVSFNVIDSIDLQIQQSKNYFRQLQYFNVCTNKIQTVNLSDKTYPYLKQLHLKNNQIKYFVHCPASLQVLTLDKNHLTELAFSGGKHLEILSVSHNKIDKIAIKTPQLTFLDMEDNEILNLDMFYEFLSNTPQILSINMLQNPINYNKNYKIIVLSTCPKIVQIDEVYINPHVRQGFRILREQQKLQEVLQKTTQNYKNRLQQQLKFKEQMIEKLKLQQKEIEQKFMTYCQRQKEEMLILEDHAKNTLGQRKFKVAEQKEQFEKKLQNQHKDSSPNKSNNQLINETKKDKKILVQAQQQKYRSEYEDFRRQNLQKMGRNQQNKMNEKGKSIYDNPIQEKNQSNQIDSLKNSSGRNRKLTKNIYRQNRDTILKRNKVQGIQPINKPAPIPKQQKMFEIKEIIDMRCIQFLKKSYSFYE